MIFLLLEQVLKEKDGDASKAPTPIGAGYLAGGERLAAGCT